MTMKLPAFIVAICLLAAVTQGGRITNQALRGIQGFRNNIGQPTSLSFSVLLPTTISHPATLNIKYPADYTQIALSSDQYHTSSCPISMTSSFISACPQITVGLNQNLQISLPDGILAGEYDILVLYNVNPSTVTTSDRIFSMSTVSQGIVIDSNDFFGEFALASSFTYTPINTILNGVASIGQIMTLTLPFTSTTATLWLRLRIPDQFSSFPAVAASCTINQPSGGLKFLSPTVSNIDNRWLLLDLLSLNSSIQYQLNLTLKLPGFQVTTDPILLQLLQNNTNSVVAAYSFSGVTTVPGVLSDVKYALSILNVYSLTNVTVNFLLTNPILNGQIVISISNGFVIAKNCTTNYNSSHWVCYSQGQGMIVPQITLFSGQNFSMQFLAINPSDPLPIYNLTIQTYTFFNGSLLLVDQAQLPIQLSQVQTPIFQAFEMYRPGLNASLSQVTALDFRLIPQKGEQLPLSSVSGSYTSTIMLQLPLWWRASSLQGWNDLQYWFSPYAPNCTFGIQGAYSCSFARQLYTITTPIQQIDSKYPSNKGLGQCDKPISIKSIMMPPIPGRYDFRVLTFQNKSTSGTPTEQDMFTMDIPVDAFPSLTVDSSSIEAADEHNLLKVSFQAGLQVPDEGVINLNFSVVGDSTSSAWENQLGYSAIFDPTKNYRSIPCGLYLRGSLQPTPQCYIYDLSPKGFNVLQVSNFGVLSPGDSVVLLVPNIKFCLTAGKACSVAVNTAYTISLTNPYYLNKQNVQLVQSVLPATTYSTITMVQDPSLALLVSSPSLCTNSVWTLKLSPATPAQVNDYIIVSVPSQYIYLSVGSIWSDNGTVGIIVDSQNQMLNIVIKVSTISGGTQSITLHGMTHPYEEGTVLALNLNFWSSKLKSAMYTLPSVAFSGNGILYTSMGILPDSTNNLAKTTSDPDLGSDLVLRYGFTLCKPVAAGGAIVIDVKDGIAYDSNCVVYSFGNQISFTSLDNTIQCTLTNGAYVITGFKTSSPMLSVTTIIKLNINTSFTLDDIKLYSYNVSTPLGGLVGSNLAAAPVSYILGQTGFTYPSLLSFDPFVQTTRAAVQYQRGEFYFIMNPNFTHSFPQVMRFSFFGSTIGTIQFNQATTTDGRLHCRVNGTLADKCTLVSYVIQLTLPIGYSMLQGQTYIVSLSTRGRDNSITGYQGLTLQGAGINTVNVEASPGTSNYESRWLAIEVLPSTFWSFSVYSMSKNVNTRTHIESGITTVVINFGCTIPSGSKLIVSLYRQHAGTDGFEVDLGTGIENGGDFPCYLNFGSSAVVCTLYYGIYPNPTQIEITGFGAISGYYEIRLPNIFNPNVSLAVVQVGLMATLTSSAGVTSKLYSSTYDFVNCTFGLPSPLINDVVYQNLTASHPTFNCNNVSTYCILTMPIKTGPLWNSYLDNIVFQFPSDYPIDDGYVYSNWPFCYNCSLCYSRAHMISMNTWWGLPANTLTSGWMNISTPLYRSLSGAAPITIKTLLYKDFKLMKVTWMNITQSFTQVKLLPNLTCDDSNINQFTSYRITINMSVSARSSAVFLIEVPSQLNASAGICQIQTPTGILLTNGFFKCSIWNGNSSLLLAENFGALAKQDIIVIVVKVLNPSTVIPVSNWTLQLFHLKEQPLDKLIAQGTVSSVPITNTLTSKLYWDQQFKVTADVLAGDRGTLVIWIKQDVGSGISSIWFPNGAITVSINRQLLCLVTTNVYKEESYETSALSKTVPLKCTLSGNTITVPQITPYLQATNAYTKLVLTTLNDNNGVTFPQSGQFNIRVMTYGGASNTHPVYIPQRKFTSFTTSSLVTNPQSLTLITVSFVPSVSASSISLHFPIVDFKNKSRPIYSGDLGTGLADGVIAGCFGRQGYPNSSLACSIQIGRVDDPGYTAIVISQPVSAGTLYVFEIDSIITPAIDGNDYTHVTHTLESYDASGNVVDHSQYLDYTVRNIAYSNQPISYTPVRSTNNINDTGVSFTLSLKNYVASSAGDYIIIEFPQQFYSPIPQTIKYANLSYAWVSTGNNWVIYQPATGLAVNSAISLKLFDCVNSFIVSSNIVLKAYYVTNRVVVRSYTFQPMPVLLVPSGTTYIPPTTPPTTTFCNIHTITTTSTNSGTGIQLLESKLILFSSINNAFTLTVSAPAANFTLLKAYTSPNSSQSISGDVATFKFEKTLSANKIVVYLQGYQLIRTVFHNFTLTNQLGTTLDSSIDQFTAPDLPTLDMSTYATGRRYRAMKQESAQLRLSVTLLSPMLRGQYMEINVGTWSYFTPYSGGTWLAYFNELAAEKTVYSGGLIQVYSPILGIGTGASVTLTIIGASMSMGSSSASASMTHKLASGSVKQTYTKYLVPLNYNFVTGTPVLSFISSTQGQYSILKASLALRNTLTPADTVKIIFTTHSTVLGQSLFDPTLGGYSNLQSTDCIAEILTKCNFELGADYTQAPTMISMTPLSNTNSLTLSIPKLSIPLSSSTTFLSVSFLLINNGANVSQLVPEYVMFPEVRPTSIYPPTAPMWAFTPSPNLIGAAASFMIIPANSLTAFSYDRVVLEYADEFIMEQPFNFNNPSLTTSLTNGNVIMYPIIKWLELSVNYDFQGSTPLTISNLKNSGWEKGLTVRIIEMGPTQYRSRYSQSATPTANIPQTSYAATPSPVTIGQFETFTITIRPANRIYKGGEIQIALPNVGMTGSQYCTVISGLTSAKCEVDWASLKIRMYGFSQYQPIIVDPFNYANNLPNPIKLSFQASMPMTTSPALRFDVSIFNDSSLGSTNEQQLSVNSMISIQSATILDVQLQSLNVAPQLIRGNSYGTIALNFQLSNTLSFVTSDYLTIDFGDSVVSRSFNPTTNLYYPQYNYIMCHFSIKNTLVQKVKTHRCEFTQWTILNVYVPEQFNLQPGTQYKLTIESVLLNSSDIYWLKFGYVHAGVAGNERGWMQWTINPAPFQTLTPTLLTSQASTANSNRTGNIMNLTLQTPLALPASTGNVPSRIVLQFPTHNEQNITFPMNLLDGQVNSTQQIGCGGTYVGVTRPMPFATSAGLTCYSIMAAGNTWNNTPAYITVNNYAAIPAATAFNFQVGRFSNPMVPNTFADFSIRIQKRTNIGQWVTLNDNIYFNIIPSVLPAPSPSTVNPSFSHSYHSSVGDNFGWYYVTMRPNFPLYANDVVTLRYSYPFQVPLGATCTQTVPSTGARLFEACSTLPFDNVYVLTNNYDLPIGSQWQTIDYYSFTNPAFTYNNSGAAAILHFQVYSQQKLVLKYTTTMTSYKKGSYVVLQPTTDDNEELLPQLYHVGVSVQSVSSSINYIEITAPTNFTAIQSCTVNRGLRQFSPANPIVCSYASSGSGWLIKLSNFRPYSGDGLIILDMVLVNPASGWTSTWGVTSFLAEGNYENRITQSPAVGGGSIWVGKAPSRPLHFYVYRNTQAFEDRRATINQYGQLWARVIPRSSHSSQSSILLSMPTSYDLPNSQKTDCNVSYTTNQVTPSSSCTINSNRSVTMAAGASGIPQQCQIFSATSYNSVDNKNGFLLPPNITGTEQFSVGIYDSSNAEETLQVVAPRPYPLTPITVDATVREAGYQTSIIRLKFQPNTPVPAGYYADLPIGYQGRIEVLFQTLYIDSSFYSRAAFTTTLGYSANNQNVPCKAVSGLTGNVVCHIQYALRSSSFDYATVIVSGFEAIANNTPIELHLLKITYAQTYYSGRANVGVRFYQVDERSNRVDLCQPTFYTNALSVTYTDYIYSQYYIPFYYQTVAATLTPNFVGAYTIMTFFYTLSVGLNPGCMIQLDFPSEFNIALSGSITAESAGQPLTVVIYEQINSLLLTFSSVGDNTLTVRMLMDAAFVFTYAVNIQMSVICSNSVMHHVTLQVTPPSPAPFSMAIMKLSDYTASHVAVNYTFTLVPSYPVPVGSILTVTFPTLTSGLNYSNLSHSNPKEICTSSIGVCSIVPNKLTISPIATVLQPGEQYTIVLSGVKNPPFTGLTPNNSYLVTITTPSHGVQYLMFSSYIQAFLMYPVTAPNRLYLIVTGSSYFKQVTSDYQIAVQTSTYTPKSTTLLLDLPVDWCSQPIVSSITGNWNLNSLFYSLSQTSNATYTQLSLLLNFDIPGKSILTIKFKPIMNPTTAVTSNFQARTIYDSTVLDETLDPVVVSFVPTPQALSIASFNWQPSNEFATSLYNLSFNIGSTTLPESGKVVLYFPDGYVSGLLGELPMVAYLNGEQVQASIDTRKLTLTTIETLPSGSQVSILLYGVINPPAATYFIDLALVDTNNDVTEYANQQIQLATTNRPPNLFLSYMDLSNYGCASISLMKVCFQAYPYLTAGTLTNTLWIQLPQEFEQTSATTISISVLGSAAVAVPFTVEQERKLISIQLGTLITSSSAVGSSLSVCILIEGIKNSGRPGESHPLTVSFYDPTNNVLRLRNYPNLNSFNTFYLTKEKLSVTVSPIGDFSSATCSLPVGVTLQRSPAGIVKLQAAINKFTVIPNPIVFQPGQTTSSFVILPQSDSPYGINTIFWSKTEYGSDLRYSELTPSYFKLTKHSAVQYQISLSTILTQSPILQRSRNITLTVPISPALPLQVVLEYGKSPECISFSSNPIVFQPGSDTSLVFTYNSSKCAVSDFIYLKVAAPYDSLYTLYSPIITVELTQPDLQPPTIINHYVFDLDRNYIVYRVMTSEPSTVYCMLTLRGTSQPTVAELLNQTLRTANARKTAVTEHYTSNHSVTTLLSTYVSYDTYLNMQSLVPDTHYQLYFIAVDLSGNPSSVVSAPAITNPEHFSAMITLCLDQATPYDTIRNVIVESSSWDAAHISIYDVPDESSSYLVQLVPYASSLRPITVAQNMDADIIFIQQSLSLCSGFTFTENSYENMSFANGWMQYGVAWSSDAQIQVWAVAQQAGWIYASTGGSYPEQIRSGLTADNFALYQTWFSRVYAQAGQNVTLKVSQLYDQTSYQVFLAAENGADPPLLMPDESVARVVTKTAVTIYSLPVQYVSSPRLTIWQVLVLLAIISALL